MPNNTSVPPTKHQYQQEMKAAKGLPALLNFLAAKVSEKGTAFSSQAIFDRLNEIWVLEPPATWLGFSYGSLNQVVNSYGDTVRAKVRIFAHPKLKALPVVVQVSNVDRLRDINPDTRPLCLARLYDNILSPIRKPVPGQDNRPNWQEYYTLTSDTNYGVSKVHPLVSSIRVLQGCEESTHRLYRTVSWEWFEQVEAFYHSDNPRERRPRATPEYYRFTREKAQQASHLPKHTLLSLENKDSWHNTIKTVPGCNGDSVRCKSPDCPFKKQAAVDPVAYKASRGVSALLKLHDFGYVKPLLKNTHNQE